MATSHNLDKVFAQCKYAAWGRAWKMKGTFWKYFNIPTQPKISQDRAYLIILSPTSASLEKSDSNCFFFVNLIFKLENLTGSRDKSFARQTALCIISWSDKNPFDFHDKAEWDTLFFYKHQYISAEARWCLFLRQNFPKPYP